MELWIRSQDKEQLRKIVDLKYQKGTIDDGNIEAILGTTQYDEWEVLGIYKSKERTLEVLDEIQKLLKPIYKITSDFKKSEITGNCQWVENQEYIPIQSKVYEMPEN